MCLVFRLQSESSVWHSLRLPHNPRPPPPTHTGESLFLDSRGRSHTPLQVRSSQPQHRLTTPLRSVMKTSPFICENRGKVKRQKRRSYNPSTPNIPPLKKPIQIHTICSFSYYYSVYPFYNNFPCFLKTSI